MGDIACFKCDEVGYHHRVDGWLHKGTLSVFCATPMDTDDPNYTRHFLQVGQWDVGDDDNHMNYL